MYFQVFHIKLKACGVVKTITNEYRTILKTGITLRAKYDYNKNSKNIQ